MGLFDSKGIGNRIFPMMRGPQHKSDNDRFKEIERDALPAAKKMQAVHDAIHGNKKRFLEKAKREWDERQARKNRVQSLPSYMTNPVGFVRDILAEEPWSRQRKIMESVRDCRRTAVPSCHDSGKSFTASRVAAWWLSCHAAGEAFVVTTAPTTAQVKAILWREINKAHTKGNLPGRTNQVEWYIGNELVGFGRKPDDMDLSAFQGIHARYVLVILDEACGVVKQLWDAADTLITNENSRILAIGNPDDPTAHFSTVCKPGSGWNILPISAFDTPNFTGEQVPDIVKESLVSRIWVEEKRKSWGEQSPLWIAKVTGQFPEVGEDNLIPIGYINAAVARELVPDTDNTELGIDVARFGKDATKIYMKQGSVFKLYKSIRKRDTMFVTGEIVNAINATGARVVKVDDTGLGGGVTDRLREIVREEKDKLAMNHPDARPNVARCQIYGVIVGQSASNKKRTEKMYNLRAELYWELRERFVNGDIAIDNNEDCHSQLAMTKYSVDSKGRILIESKEDMKDRGLPSPDDADAMMLANADPALFKLPEWMEKRPETPQIAVFQL